MKKLFVLLCFLPFVLAAQNTSVHIKSVNSAMSFSATEADGNIFVHIISNNVTANSFVFKVRNNIVVDSVEVLNPNNTNKYEFRDVKYHQGNLYWMGSYYTNNLQETPQGCAIMKMDTSLSIIEVIELADPYAEVHTSNLYTDTLIVNYAKRLNSPILGHGLIEIDLNTFTVNRDTFFSNVYMGHSHYNMFRYQGKTYLISGNVWAHELDENWQIVKIDTVFYSKQKNITFRLQFSKNYNDSLLIGMRGSDKLVAISFNDAFITKDTLCLRCESNVSSYTYFYNPTSEFVIEKELYFFMTKITSPFVVDMSMETSISMHKLHLLDPVWNKEFKIPNSNMVAISAFPSSIGNYFHLVYWYYDITSGTMHREIAITTFDLDGNHLSTTPVFREPVEAALYPNPAPGYVRLLAPENRQYDVLLYDATGKLVAGFKNVEPKQPLDLSHLPKGLYHGKITIDGEEPGIFQKVVLE